MKLTFTADYTAEEEQHGSVMSTHYEPVYPKVSMEFEATTLNTIYAQFRDFLRGCGFHIEFEIGELEPCVCCGSVESKPSPGTKAVDELREEYHHKESEK